MQTDSYDAKEYSQPYRIGVPTYALFMVGLDRPFKHVE